MNNAVVPLTRTITANVWSPSVFVPSWRTPILLYSLIEKAFMVYLVATNFGEDFAAVLAEGRRCPAHSAWRP